MDSLSLVSTERSNLLGVEQEDFFATVAVQQVRGTLEEEEK
jgi:hypothetical protein